METYSNTPLLFIDNLTMAKAFKNEAFIFLAKNWSKLNKSVYIDDSTFRIDLKTNVLFEEFKRMLNIKNNIDTVYLSFSSKQQKLNFQNIFLDRNLEYGLTKIYGDISGVRMKQTTEFKKREKQLLKLELI